MQNDKSELSGASFPVASRPSFLSNLAVSEQVRVNKCVIQCAASDTRQKLYNKTTKTDRHAAGNHQERNQVRKRNTAYDEIQHVFSDFSEQIKSDVRGVYDNHDGQVGQDR